MRYELMSQIEALVGCRSLIEENFRESGMGDCFNPPPGLYEALSNTPSFALVAFDGPTPVGIASIVIYAHQHSGKLVATNDTFFVSQKYRGTTIAGRLFRMSESEARKRGCEVFEWACAEGSALACALRRRGQVGQVSFFRSLR